MYIVSHCHESLCLREIFPHATMFNPTSADPPPKLQSSPLPDAIVPTPTYVLQPPSAAAQPASVPLTTAQTLTFSADASATASASKHGHDSSLRRDAAASLPKPLPAVALVAEAAGVGGAGGTGAGAVAHGHGHRASKGGLRKRWKRLVRRITCMHAEGSSAASAANNALIDMKVS